MQGDYGSHYYPHHYPPNPNPNPNPNEFPPSSNPIFASAPPYSNPELPPYHQSSPNPDPITNLPPSVPPYQSQPHAPFAQEHSLSAPSYPHLHQPYYPYEPHQPPAANYAPPPPIPNPSPYPSYENPNPPRFDQGGEYFGGGSYGHKDYKGIGDDTLSEGVYAYDGGRVEPYGARGTGGFSGSYNSSSETKFDDFGRPLGTSLGGTNRAESQPKIVRAVPKMESEQDVKNGVQKFRVKLLPEGASVTTSDVLCQVR